MGRTVPTTTQQLKDMQTALTGFRRTLRRSDQYIFDGLFALAHRHLSAISMTDALLPFEAALLAILLEQSKEIAVLRQQMDVLTNDFDHRLVN